MGKSETMIPMNSNKDDAATQLWRTASTHRPTARLLDEVLRHKTHGRILLLHREELFPRLTAHFDSSLSFTFGTSVLALLSHPAQKLAQSLKILDKKRRSHSYQAPRQERATELVRELDDVTRQTLTDNVALEILKLVQSSSVLRTLVTRGDPVTYESFKQKVGDYSSLNLEPVKTALFQLFQRVLGGQRSKESIHQLAMEVDVLNDFVDADRLQLILLQTSLSHYRRLLRGLRIQEIRWKEAALALHFDHFLEHVGPIRLWCTKCPEAGVSGTVHATQLLKPLRCPRCSRLAQTATTLSPAGALGVAIGLRDGMLGAAIGWQLAKRRISFRHSPNVRGTELDFLASRGPVHCLIECKMNHQLKDRPHLAATLTENLTQLNAHVLAAQSAGISLQSAVCVVNHTPSQLAVLRRLVRPPQQSAVRMQLISYQDFVPWLSNQSSLCSD